MLPLLMLLLMPMLVLVVTVLAIVAVVEVGMVLRSSSAAKANESRTCHLCDSRYTGDKTHI